MRRKHDKILLLAKIMKKKRKKHCKIVLLAKNKLNIVEILISRTLIDLYIKHDEFVSVNNCFSSSKFLIDL